MTRTHILDPKKSPQEYNFVEEEELWPPPEDCPAFLKKYMPNTEHAENNILWRIFFKEKPLWWTRGYGIYVLNLRRRQVYLLWKKDEFEIEGLEGELEGD